MRRKRGGGVSQVKAKDLRGLSVAELDQKKAALEKPHQFKQIRRQVAQINTLKREK